MAGDNLQRKGEKRQNIPVKKLQRVRKKDLKKNYLKQDPVLELA